MANYQIIRHPLLESDLYKLVDLVADYAGTKVAKRKLLEIEEAINRLRNTPHIGSVRNEIYPDLRAIPVAGKGVLCFTVDDDNSTVAIICLAYAGGNWENILQER